MSTCVNRRWTSDCRKRHETTSGERIEEVVSQNLHSQKSNNLQKQNPLKHRVSRDFPLVLPECHLSEYTYTPSGSILPISHLFGQSVSVSKVFRHAESTACTVLFSYFLIINSVTSAPNSEAIGISL